LENHAAIDFAKNMFDFGGPGFWELVHAIRVSALEAAWQHGVPLVVATFCYSHPEDRPLFKQFEAIVNRSRGQLLPVFLHCSEEEMACRIGNADRVERRKLTSIDGLNRFRANYRDSPITELRAAAREPAAPGTESPQAERTRPCGPISRPGAVFGLRQQPELVRVDPFILAVLGTK